MLPTSMQLRSHPGHVPNANVLLEWLLERAPFGVVWTAGDGTVSLNAEAARILALEVRPYAADEWTELVRLEDLGGRPLSDIGERPLSRALDGVFVTRSRMKVVRPDGSRVEVCVEAFPVARDGALGAIVMFEDVAWTLASEKEQVDWLGALGHELNGSLQHFLTATQAAHLYLGKDPGKVLHHLAAAQKQTQHMRRLVRDFVDSARLGSGVFTCKEEVFPLSGLLFELAETAELGDARHRISTDVEEELYVRADVDRVRQIVMNLLSNAAKYSNPGLVYLGARRDGDRVLVWLKDEGPGIPEDAQIHLFRRFGRLPSRTEGSGLGLWIARELARRMHGDLWVQSEAGRPTTFFVALPAAPPLGPAVEQPGRQG